MTSCYRICIKNLYYLSLLMITLIVLIGCSARHIDAKDSHHYHSLNRPDNRPDPVSPPLPRRRHIQQRPFRIAKVYFTPNPVGRGSEGFMIAEYEYPHEVKTVLERWRILFNGRQLIKPIELRRTLSGQFNVRKLPFLIPADAVPGLYEFSLEAKAQRKWHTARSKFIVR